MNLWATWTVFRFECVRTLTLPRLVFSAALMLFPVAMVILIQYQGGHLERDSRAAIALFILIPQVLCLMGLLLWATPVIHTELEGRTWAYLAYRPAGKGSVLVGKYLNAAVWTALTALLSLSVSMAIVRPEVEALRVGGVIAALTLLACFSYGALYVFLGVVFLRRAMVAAVAYTFLSEVALSWIPATVHHFTVQYHLRCLGMKWMGWTSLTGQAEFDERLLFSAAPAWQHLLILLVFTAVLLGAAVLILRRRELLRAVEI